MSAQTKTNEPKPAKFGKIEVPINSAISPYIPTNSKKFIDHGDILKTMAIAIRDNLTVLLIGESGTGKTSAIRYLAQETNNGLRRVNLNGGTTADELVGRLLINDKGTYWVDGVLTEAMRKGEWIVLDEINAALPEVLFVLQSVMDDDGYIVLNEKDDKEIVHKHPGFRLFATCNPPEYAGTKEMNKALLSRFSICISAEFPPVAKELEIIENHLGNAVAKGELASKLVGLANETRKAKELGTADYAINTRDILNTLTLANSMEPIDALALAFSNKLDSGDGKALKLMAKLHLPTKKRANQIRKTISTAEDLVVGNTYIMDADLHNAYFELTDNKTKFESLIKTELINIVRNNNNRNNGSKGDEFTVEATYYENIDGKAMKTKPTTSDGNVGEKIGSAINITAGPNKGKMAIMIHHKDLENSDVIIKNLYELC